LNNNRGNNRRRGRGNNRPQGGGQQLNRIDSRARGNAPQLLEKYRKMAQDAHLNGDRVQAEYYLQFADHYFRVIADTRLRQEEARQRHSGNGERWNEARPRTTAWTSRSKAISPRSIVPMSAARSAKRATRIVRNVPNGKSAGTPGSPGTANARRDRQDRNADGDRGTIAGRAAVASRNAARPPRPPRRARPWPTSPCRSKACAPMKASR
jgi:hypothetical protein